MMNDPNQQICRIVNTIADTDRLQNSPAERYYNISGSFFGPFQMFRIERCGL